MSNETHTPPERLSFIAWIHRPKPPGELDGYDEGFDFCLDCAEEIVEKLKAKYPQHAEEIFVMGGDCLRESDYLAACSECHCCLACCASEADGQPVETQAEWDAMAKKLDEPIIEGDNQ